MAIANALQLEAARASPALSRFKNLSNHCRVIAFLLLIHYFTLWPRPLTCWPWTYTALRMSCVYTLRNFT